ncbi:MAG: DUF4173 domain-containing protein [Paracoccaceae bacterium]
MKTAVIRGVPLAMQRDGWWMDGVKPRTRKPVKSMDSDMGKLLVLLALIAFGDAMIWHVWPGLSLAVFALAVIGACLLFAPNLSRSRLQICLIGAALSVLPVIEVVQPLSVFFLLAGGLVVLCGIAGVSHQSLLRSFLRYPWIAIAFSFRDGLNLTSQLHIPNMNIRELVMGWAIPLGLGLVFLLLFGTANPLIADFLEQISLTQVPEPNMMRLIFWGVLAFVIWGALIAPRLRNALTARKPQRHMVHRPGLINTRSLGRSMVLFNLMFAVQTFMDFAFLYGATELPEGVTYATYAHRGAYPLLITALLAGAFAVLARPLTDQSSLLRKLLILWLVQTIMLVGASVTRLDLYIDVYGLTRLRLAAGIWMAVVLLGLLLVLWQVYKGHKTSWLLMRNASLGLGTLYVCCFINFDGVIAQHNFTTFGKQDLNYLCSLSEGVLPELDRQGVNVEYSCPEWRRPEMSQPKDWREWGFRNWRLRRSLAQSEVKDVYHDPYH